MGKKKKNDQEAKVIVAEFNVSMHCNACERTVAKTLSKLKGVEKFTTDMNKHKVVVTGKMDPQKVLKKLRKKTGKKVEIVVDKEEKPNDASDEGNLSKPFFDCCKETDILMMFSDENPNACCMM
ncbi:heavy metal-associated isoprenylated plant protein 19 [Prunus avium]|uniref:Heavy metal-associated isoprenylated plant protein 19 n=1 Tax=Prunus avium TaxID=42229 RepID=A0A6P5S557_PRUAV|nr:heavy metal-associated isoprenylated plant protein 19 [Prunus avium]